MIVSADENQGRKLRADIQALRAIAVIVVILDHMVLLQRLPGRPEGGFIGVDVFFVISGFLITGHLISEAATSGHVSFLQFYARRARRILPMAVLVAVVSIIAAFLVFWPSQAWRTLVDGIWSLLFVSNVNFALAGTDYFSDGTPSIFQHYWSLSVEEQFYLAWPLVIAAVAAVLLHRRRLPALGRTVAIVAVVIGLASFAWAIHDSASSPASAYFSTFSRAFEFVLGGLVAAAAPLLLRLPRAVRIALSLAGLTVIVVSVWMIEPAGAFPGPLALLPAAGAALFIAAGTGSAGNVAIWPLATRPIGYVGDISYSLYLWHWPVIVLVSSVVPVNSLVFVVGVVGLTAGLSVISYRFVERPVLSSGWLLSRDRRSSAPKPRWRPAIVVMSISLVVAALGFGGIVVATSSDAVPTPAASLQLQRQPDAAGAAVSQIQRVIAEGGARSSWLGLSPSIDDLGDGVSGQLRDECWNARDSVSVSCVLGPEVASQSVAILGDSIAMNMVPGIETALAGHPDWNLLVHTKAGCPAMDVSVFDTDGSIYVNCETFRDLAIDDLLDTAPDVLIIVSASVASLPGVADESVTDAWQAGLESTLARLESIPRILIVSPTPVGRSLSDCANRFSTPANCWTAITASWIDERDATVATAGRAGRTYIDTGLWFCNEAGECPPVIGDYVVRRDPRHLTAEYSRSLAPLFDAWIWSEDPLDGTP